MEPDYSIQRKESGLSEIATLSVIIVNYNTRDLLEQCLESVFSSVCDVKLQVIVSDNGSNDSSLQMCHEKFPDVLVIDNNENLGFGAANNVAKAYVKGNFILFLNSDTIVHADTFQSSIKFLIDNPGIGAMGCRLNHKDNCVQLSVAPFTSFSLSIKTRIKCSPLATQRPEYYDEDHLSVDYVAGAFLMARAEILEKVSWFDEQFFMYAEEMDLCLRIAEAGYAVGYFSGTTTIHFGGMSSKGSNRSDLWRMISKLRFIKKHHSFGYFQMFRLFSLLSMLSKCLVGRGSFGFCKKQISGYFSLKYQIGDSDS